MKKRIVRAIAILFALSTVVTGCSKDVKTTIPSNDAAKEQSTADIKNKEPITLSITWWGSQIRHGYTARVLELYSKNNPNIKFEATPSGWDGYFDKMAAQAAGNSMPDIVQMDYLYISNFTKNNALTDLTPFVGNNTLDMSDVDQSLRDTGIIDGKLTGAVLSSTAMTMVVNPDVFNKAGIELPKSDWKWSEFEQAMQTISERTDCYGFAANLQSDTNILSYWIRQYGTTLYAADGTKLGYDDDQIFIDYLSMVYRLTKSKAIPTPDEWLKIASKGKEAQPVVTGEAGTTLEWANFPVIVEKSNPNLITVIPPYAYNGKKALWIKPGMFFSISESSKNKEEAAKFISWLINDIEANKIISTERGTPVAKKVREALAIDLTSIQKQMFDYMELAVIHSAHTDPAEPVGNPEICKIMADQMSLVIYDKATPEQAAADFRKMANEVLARDSIK